MEPAGKVGGTARSGDRSASRSSTPPKAVGRYQTGRLLGEGAMGRVYQATDPELGRDVAIKVLRLEAAGSAREAYIARFRNEARAAARFMHPNVVAVYDAGVDPQLGPYLVYEYVGGPTLRARIEQGRLEPREIVALARGVGAALDALHAAGIIHRDVKPDNILLTHDGTVKLTDFGIARVPNAQLTRDGQFLGTPAYAAPEAITKGEYSIRGDVFSFAAVLYEALCGIRPFPGEDAVSVSYAVANDTPLPPSRHVLGLPAAVDAAFARALAKRQGERFASAGELAEALAAGFRRPSGASASASQPLIKRPQHPPPPVEPERPRAPVLPVVLIAVSVTVLAALVARRWASKSEPAPPAPAAAVAAQPAAQPSRQTSSAATPRATRARPAAATRAARDGSAEPARSRN